MTQQNIPSASRHFAEEISGAIDAWQYTRQKYDASPDSPLWQDNHGENSRHLLALWGHAHRLQHPGPHAPEHDRVAPLWQTLRDFVATHRLPLCQGLTLAASAQDWHDRLQGYIAHRYDDDAIPLEMEFVIYELFEELDNMDLAFWSCDALLDRENPQERQLAETLDDLQCGSDEEGTDDNTVVWIDCFAALSHQPRVFAPVYDYAASIQRDFRIDLEEEVPDLLDTTNKYFDVTGIDVLRDPRDEELEPFTPEEQASLFGEYDPAALRLAAGLFQVADATSEAPRMSMSDDDTKRHDLGYSQMLEMQAIDKSWTLLLSMHEKSEGVEGWTLELVDAEDREIDDATVHLGGTAIPVKDGEATLSWEVLEAVQNSGNHIQIVVEINGQRMPAYPISR